MKRIVVMTGSDLRHTFFRKRLALSEGIEVAASYCEGFENSVQSIVDKEADSPLRKRHLAARQQSERDFFEAFVETTPDRSHASSIRRGDINTEAVIEAIRQSGADLLVAYGCSLIKGPLLTEFGGRFLNVHLGLSPYYRGSGTNFWALVNDEPECVGATFMHIDAGVDTGDIIHQLRARVEWGDTPHQIGNRLILDMTRTYIDLILKSDGLEKLPQLPSPAKEKVYKRKDFSEEAVKRLYDRFESGLVADYLADLPKRVDRYPILRQPGL